MMTPQQCATGTPQSMPHEVWHSLTIIDNATNQPVTYLPRLAGPEYAQVLREWPQRMFPKPQYRYLVETHWWYPGKAWADWCEAHPQDAYTPLDFLTLMERSVANAQRMRVNRRAAKEARG